MRVEHSAVVAQCQAANGGLDPPFDEYIPASDEASLADALDDVASSVVNCIYDIVIENEVNYDEVNFFFIYQDTSEEVVPYDEGCAAGLGWQWVGDDYSQIEFCEAACEELQAGEVVEIRGEFGCPQIAVE